MSPEQTQQMIDHCFDVMTRGGDFAVYYTADVTCSIPRQPSSSNDSS
jgi:hypothetical protein